MLLLRVLTAALGRGARSWWKLQLIGFLRYHLVDVLAQLVHAFNFTQKAISHRRRPFSRLHHR